MSVQVSVDELFEQVGRWGPCYLATVSDDQRPHLLALRPEIVTADGERVLRFDAGGGRACSNAATRPAISLVFPPIATSDGFSLVVDGRARVDGAVIDLVPSGAVLHRPAP